MTADEILLLLQVAQSYDSRNIDRLMQSAWLDASHRARWDRDAALAAVRSHYAESTERIMPGHVTTLIRAVRPVSFAPQFQRAPPPAPPASAETRDQHYRALFGERRRTQGREKRALWRRGWTFESPGVSVDGPEPLRAFEGDPARLLGRSAGERLNEGLVLQPHLVM